MDENLKVEITDGIEYLKNSSKLKKRYNAILFDVDSKDTSVGMSCPPKEFVDSDFLKTVKDCLLDEGFFILNLVARNKKLRENIVEDLKKMYDFVASYKLLDEVNDIVFCSKNKKDFTEWMKHIQESARLLNSHAKSSGSAEELIEIDSLLKNFKIES